MLNEESSTAALIPFDRVFYLTAAELHEDYRVNLFSRIKRENFELLGMFGEPEAEEEEAEASEDEFNGAEEDSENDNNNDTNTNTNNNNHKNGSTQKKKRQIMKKAKELEYDLDDPFIDDSEITDIYQSVFEMMRSGRAEEEVAESDDSDSDSKEIKKTKSKDAKNNKTTKKAASRNFFVYRGTMTPEILSKEFEIDVNELMEVEAAAASAEATENASESENEISKKKLKLKNKRSRTIQEEKPTVKKVKIQKAPKQPKVKVVKVNDLISQSTKKFNDIFSTEDTVVTIPAVFNVTGVDASLLELRETLKRFRDSAVGTPFSPGKFPSALRPKLNETLCAMLRCSRPSLQSPLPARFFPALASFLPFSSAALNKLLSRKILGPLIESMERNEVPKLYKTWEGVLGNRVKEDGSIIIVNTTVNTEDNSVLNDTVSNAVDNVNSTPNNTTFTPTLKKKLKFNDEMRQIIFEVLRTEIDVNNLIILSNTFDATTSNTEIPKVAQSELNLRKIVYQKLANYAVLPDDSVPLLSSTEISKEFGSQKRKHEKKIAKAASEILFGEAEIEEFLKELDVPKEAKITVMNNAVTETVTNTSLNADPLNLFGNEPVVENENSASNTSLFMDTTN